MKRSNICEDKTILMVSSRRWSEEAWERQSFKKACVECLLSYLWESGWVRDKRYVMYVKKLVENETCKDGKRKI